MMLSQRNAPDSPQSPAHDLGRRALFASVGGGILVFLATIGFQGRIGVLPSIAAGVVTAALMFGSLAALTNADRAMAADPSLATTDARSVQARRQLVKTTQLEYIGFIVALIVCNLANQMVWLIPAVAVIFGAHYLGLGRMFGSVISWAEGAALCLTAVVVVALLPARYPPDAPLATQVYLWWIVVGFVGGAVLWFDAARCLTLGLRGRAAKQTSAR